MITAMTETDPIGRAGAGPPLDPDISGNQAPQEFPVSFNGNTRQCFRIWIANTFLTIVTFGIYSAWAKVRMKRYMLGHTEFAGFAFDYHANPVSILVARVVLVATLLLVNHFLSPLDLVLDSYYSLVLALLIPPLIARGISFNARYTSYRTIRFNFDRKLAEAYFCFIPYFVSLLGSIGLWFFLFGYSGLEPVNFELLPMTDYEYAILFGVAVLLFLSIPYFARAYHRYRVNNHSFGGLKMSHQAPHLPYYVPFVLVPIGAGLVFGWPFMLPGDTEPVADLEIGWEAVAAVILGTMVLLPAFATFIMRAYVTRLLLDNIRFDGGRISCRLKIIPYAWMLAYTFLLTLASFWLLRPWSIVLRARRLAAATTVVAKPETLESIVGGELKREPAIGEASLDVFDFDVGLI